MDADETVAAFETDATFDGAEGTLTCAGANGATDCTVTLDADGDIDRFRHRLGSSPPTRWSRSTWTDTDYLHYGFWLQRTTDADGNDTYDEVQTFAGSND